MEKLQRELVDNNSHLQRARGPAIDARKRADDFIRDSTDGLPKEALAADAAGKEAHVVKLEGLTRILESKIKLLQGK